MVQRGRGIVPKYFKSDHHHKLCYHRREKNINVVCRWAKLNAAKKNANKTAFTSKKSVSSCCIMVPNKFHMSYEECSVVLKKRNGRHHLYSYKFSSCLESCCHWRKIASLLLIRKLDETEKGLKELSLEKSTFHSISQQRECSTKTHYPVTAKNFQ